MTQVFQRNLQYLELARRISAMGLLKMDLTTIEALGAGILIWKTIMPLQVIVGAT